jgi:hypothetical protein
MGRHNSPPPDPEDQAKKEALAAQASDLIDQPGWEYVLTVARNVVRGNYRLLRNRDTAISETNAARGAMDAIITLLKVVYTTAGKEVPSDLKPFSE